MIGKALSPASNAGRGASALALVSSRFYRQSQIEDRLVSNLTHRSGQGGGLGKGGCHSADHQEGDREYEGRQVRSIEDEGHHRTSLRASLGNLESRLSRLTEDIEGLLGVRVGEV